MPSPFHGIETASRALRAFQRSLDVTGHNIANVNTKGFSRQSADLSPTDASFYLNGRLLALGSGVQVSQISRARDLFLEARRQASMADYGRMATLADGLKQVEGAFMEPGDGGISDALGKFFNSWSALASNPADTAAKLGVQLAGHTLTQRVRSTYLELNNLKMAQGQAIDLTLGNIDRLAGEVARLNHEIRSRQAQGSSPNDLLDMRDQAIRDLSELVDIKVQPMTDGTMTIYMNQHTLVDSAGARPIPKTWDAATLTLSDGASTFNVRSGKLAGLLNSVGNIESYQAQLDSLANTLRTQVNALHAQGTNSLGATGLNFFNDVLPPDPQTGAIDFALDPLVASDPLSIASGISGAPGDGDLALQLSRMRDVTHAALGGKSFHRFFGDVMAGLARDSAHYSATLSTSAAILDQVDQQIQSVSGVSLDDEMANLMRFQRSFQAAARALTLFDQVTEDLINMLRR
jgi:flagellar hook-associated protein 1